MSGPLSSATGRSPGTVGWEEAAGLVQQVLDGGVRVRVGITGPGGAGKSTLLEELGVQLRAGGLAVARGLDDLARGDADPGRAVLLIDDAEHLGDDEVAELTSVMRGDGPHVVIAFRPWPRSAAVAELVDRLGRERPHIVLRPLSATDVADRAAVVLGAALPDEQVARLLHLTRGNPRFVDDLLLAMGESGWDLREDSPIPPAALERLRHPLDRLEPVLHDFLLSLAVGFSASGPALATAPRFAGADLRAVMSASRASGMVSPDGSLVPIVRITIMQSTPAHELWSMRRELVDAVVAAGLPLGGTALELAGHGFRDRRVAEALILQADEALVTDPVDAWRLYAASIQSGADAAAVAGRRAQAAWAAGDIRAAERLVDGVLTGSGTPDLPRVMNVAAAIWARKGMLQRSADAYVGLTETEVPAAAPLAASCLAVLGEVQQARAILAAGPQVEYPTSSQVAVSLMADGILVALEAAPDRALSPLLQATSVMSEAGEIVPLPEAPAILAAHVAVNAGELDIADDVLQSAIEAMEGGPAFRNRLRLTRALIALRADRPAPARALLESAGASQRPLGLRDEVLAHAVRIGLARRTDDLASLVRAWNAARQTVVRMPIDLTGLPALAEFAIAAARLDESHIIAEPLAAGWALLRRAGHAASWSTNLHWAEIQAAILRNDQEHLAEHSTALLDAAPSNRVAARLAEAGRIWAAALAGQVEVGEVERAVRDLAGAGYPWDAGRLAGHAAARAAEHKDTLALLALARDLHPDDPGTDSAREPAEAGIGRRDDDGLSAREREVARLVLEGKTYTEIGSAIFISPRTAEHHIARIRRRLGVTTRSELLARLRLVLDDDEDG